MRRCLKGLGGRPTSTDGFILGPVTRLSGSACFSLHVVGHLTGQLYPVATLQDTLLCSRLRESIKLSTMSRSGPHSTHGLRRELHSFRRLAAKRGHQIFHGIAEFLVARPS